MTAPRRGIWIPKDAADYRLPMAEWNPPDESQDARHDVREARLEGSYPETAISVRWFDRFYDREHIESYPVWWSIFTASDGGVEVPSQVAMLIHTWVHEQQPKPPD
jgi:hypothetical protein